MMKQNFLIDNTVHILHKFPFFRMLARQLFQQLMIKQPYYGGIICLNAVDHSWAWTGKARYSTFDQELQNRLLSLSFQNDLLVDIGANVGAITLSVLLRNSKIKANCFEPNSRAVHCLKNSIKVNQLASRVSIVNAAVSDYDGVLNFDETGSVTGHISGSTGKQIQCIDFVRLINESTEENKCLVKIDIEGFEIILLQHLQKLNKLSHLCLVVEIHPFQFNSQGDPIESVNLLRLSGAHLEDIFGRPLGVVDPEQFTQVIASWP